MIKFINLLLILLAADLFAQDRIEIDSDAPVKYITFGAESEGKRWSTIERFGFLSREAYLHDLSAHDFDYLGDFVQILGENEKKFLFYKDYKELLERIRSEDYPLHWRRKNFISVYLLYFFQKEEVESILNGKIPKEWLDKEKFLESLDDLITRKNKAIEKKIAQLEQFYIEKGIYNRSFELKNISSQTKSEIEKVLRDSPGWRKGYRVWGIYPEWEYMMSDITKDGDGWELQFKPKESLTEFYALCDEYKKYSGKYPGHVRIVIPLKKGVVVRKEDLASYSRYLSTKILFRALSVKNGLHTAYSNKLQSSLTDEEGEKFIVVVDGDDRSWRNSDNFSLEIRAGTKNKAFLKKLLDEIIEEAKVQNYEKFNSFPDIYPNEKMASKFLSETLKNKIVDRKGYQLTWENFPFLWDFKHLSWKSLLTDEEINKISISSEKRVKEFFGKKFTNEDLKQSLADWIEENNEILKKITDEDLVNFKLNALYLSQSSNCNDLLIH
ncbi:MAG: hypothetical protein H6621_10070 [Halobacteriovoraceae bacterium]|nr:hypothetical protein [Halobacteriovoraceae bacterium]MCB9095403.1 hypothetical protein [Halobacteriovoraceae bacterium]